MQTTKYNSELLFTEEEMRDKRWKQFIGTKLGQLFLTIPFQEIASRYPKPKDNPSGTVPFFMLEGGIGLMFLKAYYNGMSDEKLVELINGNWMLQLFCQMRLGTGQQIKDRGIVSRWRKYLGVHLQEEEIQQVLLEEWRGDIEDTHSNVSDATCYESYVRYPTDVKLLWEGVDWLHRQMMALCSYTKSTHPRNKFKDIKQAYLSFSKSRRKTYKKRRRMQRRLLYLLDKLFGQITPLIGLWKIDTRLGEKSPVRPNFFKRLGLVKKMYKQQKLHYERPKDSIPNRIVSLAKPYLRPIVRGKETKRVEFGKKVHKMMVGGIGLIEYGDYNAFHEGNRTINTIWKHRRYFGRCRLFGGDGIYATNKNRKYCSRENIFTCFKRKGKAGKNEKQAAQLRAIIAKERSTVLEGSFGNEKNHYALNRVKARTEETENVWIFFSIMTANAMKIAKIRAAKNGKAPP